MSLPRSLRCALSFIPLVAGLLGLAGCGDTTTTKPAEFPPVGNAPAAQTTTKAEPAKGSDRAGSEQGKPNP